MKERQITPVQKKAIQEQERGKIYNNNEQRRRRHLQARSIKMAVLVMFPAPRRQQPTTPVQKATKSKKKETMKRAIMARPISEKTKTKIKHSVNSWRPRCVVGEILRSRAMASSLKDFVSPLLSGM